MDPNETLRQLLNLAADFLDNADAEVPTVGSDMAEAVLALDGWLTSGGFLPERWRSAPLQPR